MIRFIIIIIIIYSKKTQAIQPNLKTNYYSYY